MPLKRLSVFVPERLVRIGTGATDGSRGHVHTLVVDSLVARDAHSHTNATYSTIYPALS